MLSNLGTMKKEPNHNSCRFASPEAQQLHRQQQQDLHVPPQSSRTPAVSTGDTPATQAHAYHWHGLITVLSETGPQDSGERPAQG